MKPAIIYIMIYFILCYFFNIEGLIRATNETFAQFNYTDRALGLKCYSIYVCKSQSGFIVLIVFFLKYTLKKPIKSK